MLSSGLDRLTPGRERLENQIKLTDEAVQKQGQVQNETRKLVADTQQVTAQSESPLRLEMIAMTANLTESNEVIKSSMSTAMQEASKQANMTNMNRTDGHQRLTASLAEDRERSQAATNVTLKLLKTNVRNAPLHTSLIHDTPAAL